VPVLGAAGQGRRAGDAGDSRLADLAFGEERFRLCLGELYVVAVERGSRRLGDTLPGC